MIRNMSEAAVTLARPDHSYSFEQADELTPGELGDQLYSCHGHRIVVNRVSSALIVLIPMFLGAMISNACIVYVVRRFRAVIGRVTMHHIAVFVTTDLMKAFLVILPSIIRLCNRNVLAGWMCHAGYWIHLFLLQSSILSLALSAYDRVMVLRKSESYGLTKGRWKNTLLFSVFLPLSYMTFDVVYTKVYEAKNSETAHLSEQSALCYDQKLGWCMTKAAPHEHENIVDADLSGSKRGGVFICQAHIMTVLILMSQLTLQSGHANYKKMYNDRTREGSYYLLLFALNTWLYLPSMFVTLIDTFTATVFPSAYYEEFYIYIYVIQLMPCMFNAIPLVVAYREYVFNEVEADPTRYSPVKLETASTTGKEIEMGAISRRISRLHPSTARGEHATNHSSSHSPPRSPELSIRHTPGSPVGGGKVGKETDQKRGRRGGAKDKDYFDTMVVPAGGSESEGRSVIANLQAVERAEV